METDAITTAFKTFQTQNPGFTHLLVLSRDGDILYSSEPNFITPDEAKHVMDTWQHNGPAVELGPLRFAVLKWDELQFAAKNVATKAGLVGSKTKSGKYAMVKLAPDCPTAILQASIIVNRWSWSVI
jgi:hypothetical protein